MPAFLGSGVLAACILSAASTFQIPPTILTGIYMVEGGKVGQEVRNRNGSYDLGPMQINTVHVPELAKVWGIPPSKAHALIRDDPCVNTNVSAYLLKKHYNHTKNLKSAVSRYHSKTPRYGLQYLKKIDDALKALASSPPDWLRFAD